MNKNIDITECKEFPNYDILYTDPPWEQRMVRFFETQMFKQTGVKKENSIENILTCLARLTHKKPAFIEYSIKGHELVIEIMEQYGHTFNYKQQLLQTNNKPYIVMVFNSNVIIPEGMNGEKVIHYVVSQFDKPLVFDPFAGIGFTAKHVFSSGGKYIGYEINKNRFDRLQKLCAKYENL